MRVVIIGGGTAGWISALMINRTRPQDEVVVVSSSEIGILGAGEGTTPHFIGQFLDMVGVPVSALVKHVGATVKHAIRFVNWRGDGGYYHHPFADDVTGSPNMAYLNPDAPLAERDWVFTARLAEQHRVPMSRVPAYERPDGDDPLLDFRDHARYALHFDAVKLAKYLKEVAASRGVTHIDDIVTDLGRAPNGHIRKLRTKSGQVIDCDFLVDCTGFRRLVIGDAFKTPYKNLRNILPVNRAIPFTLDLDGPLPPYTEARAMKAGWAWKIPTRERFGCGYVFDSDFASDDEARQEIREEFGYEGDLDKVFSFQSGYAEKVWVKNVIGVGLSTAFLEPLEATSIWVTLMTLRRFLKHHLPLGIDDPVGQDELNDYHRRLHDRIVDFLYLHYLTPRNDTPFWSTFQTRTDRPPAVEALLRSGGLRWLFDERHEIGGAPDPFPAASWTWVALGNGIMDEDAHRRYWSAFNLGNGWGDRAQGLTKKVRKYADACTTHDEFLEHLARQAPDVVR